MLRESLAEVHVGLHLAFEPWASANDLLQSLISAPTPTALRKMCTVYGLLVTVTWALCSHVEFSNLLYLEWPSSLCVRQVPIPYQGQFKIFSIPTTLPQQKCLLPHEWSPDISLSCCVFPLMVHFPVIGGIWEGRKYILVFLFPGLLVTFGAIWILWESGWPLRWEGTC